MKICDERCDWFTANEGDIEQGRHTCMRYHSKIYNQERLEICLNTCLNTEEEIPNDEDCDILETRLYAQAIKNIGSNACDDEKVQLRYKVIKDWFKEIFNRNFDIGNIK